MTALTTKSRQQTNKQTNTKLKPEKKTISITSRNYEQRKKMFIHNCEEDNKNVLIRNRLPQ
jgi:hypothetical protein